MDEGKVPFVHWHWVRNWTQLFFSHHSLKPLLTYLTAAAEVTFTDILHWWCLSVIFLTFLLATCSFVCAWFWFIDFTLQTTLCSLTYSTFIFALLYKLLTYFLLSWLKWIEFSVANQLVSLLLPVRSLWYVATDFFILEVKCDKVTIQLEPYMGSPLIPYCLRLYY